MYKQKSYDQAKALLKASPKFAHVSAFVLCPARREIVTRMFSSTRDHLSELGFSTTHRMQGIDLKHIVNRGADLRPNQVVAKAFEKTFLPRALAEMDRDPAKKIALMLLDDTRMLKKTALL